MRSTPTLKSYLMKWKLRGPRVSNTKSGRPTSSQHINWKAPHKSRPGQASPTQSIFIDKYYVKSKMGMKFQWDYYKATCLQLIHKLSWPWRESYFHASKAMHATARENLQPLWIFHRGGKFVGSITNKYAKIGGQISAICNLFSEGEILQRIWLSVNETVCTSTKQQTIACNFQSFEMKINRLYTAIS